MSLYPSQPSPWRSHSSISQSQLHTVKHQLSHLTDDPGAVLVLGLDFTALLRPCCRVSCRAAWRGAWRVVQGNRGNALLRLFPLVDELAKLLGGSVSFNETQTGLICVSVHAPFSLPGYAITTPYPRCTLVMTLSAARCKFISRCVAGCAVVVRVVSWSRAAERPKAAARSHDAVSFGVVVGRPPSKYMHAAEVLVSPSADAGPSAIARVVRQTHPPFSPSLPLLSISTPTNSLSLS
jgi:hypothetical protein